ncbi:MAG: hypothetical protein A2977_02800 [Alphaproteobacteria bacterium RIFCSPLOWO2_01_FULL_45_8]|nr:MAG: hypothetical protein A2065_03870 [Alphaproteobacteria bacterium GWB1_45_5]OFW75942.1 MAG: hypothetical protein A3K20_03920 [Alphaproteobacteria bacterium GWA1_45_9]OFW90034.1 MAG: hypothetical protein A2621_04125 [Alphaproteobacteria bacterium RIFCSPHIGHO2_01_FULL_41_14]OFW96681.1 MAG: hypothetical protein A2977_02800 [Alphaproteobacteria bacterium RIFCSPLOWO2_01_FULL_45_8]HCI49190.1 hypothetical protein [Holosporales bacterium]
MFDRFLKLSRIAFFMGMIFSFHSDAATGGTPLDEDQQPGASASSMALVPLSQGQPTLQDLPPELIGEIAQFLGPQDCKNLRLTCRALAQHIKLPNIKITPERLDANGFLPIHTISSRTHVAFRCGTQFSLEAYEHIIVTRLAGLHLHSLDLGYNSLGAEGAQYLASSLSQLTHLRSLYLNTNNLGVVGAGHLASALSQLTHLRVLYLHHNGLNLLSDRQHLASILRQQLPYLLIVSLYDNPPFNEDINHIVSTLQQMPPRVPPTLFF